LKYFQFSFSQLVFYEKNNQFFSYLILGRVKNLQESYQKDFQFENSKELIILDEKQEKITKDFFKMISREFAGYSEELN